jgi:hypothetical protein
MVDFVWIKTV